MKFIAIIKVWIEAEKWHKLCETKQTRFLSVAKDASELLNLRNVFDAVKSGSPSDVQQL